MYQYVLLDNDVTSGSTSGKENSREYMRSVSFTISNSSFAAYTEEITSYAKKIFFGLNTEFFVGSVFDLLTQEGCIQSWEKTSGDIDKNQNIDFFVLTNANRKIPIQVKTRTAHLPASWRILKNPATGKNIVYLYTCAYDIPEHLAGMVVTAILMFPPEVQRCAALAYSK